jgi:hypothetical protein
MATSKDYIKVNKDYLDKSLKLARSKLKDSEPTDFDFVFYTKLVSQLENDYLDAYVAYHKNLAKLVDTSL